MLRTTAVIIGYVSLLALIMPSIIYLAGRMELDMVKWLMLLATIVWFAAALCMSYMNKRIDNR